MRLTVRVDEDNVVASTDDGATIHLDLNGNPGLQSAVRDLAEALSGVDDSGAFDRPSAPALSSLAESAGLQPRSDVPLPPHPIASATDGRRVPLGLLADGATSSALSDVLARRRSRRELAPVAIDDLAPVLMRAGRTRAVADGPGGGRLESRPYPSAGARHPVELAVAAAGVDGLDDGWWWFDPFTCELAPICAQPDPVEALATVADVAAMGRPPTAAVFAIASFDRTLSRYPTGATLVWRDAGAVLVTVHLVATDRGLASCIVGTSGTVRVATLAAGESAVEVGAVAIGTTPDLTVAR